MTATLRICGQEVCEVDQLWMAPVVTQEKWRMQAIRINLPFSVESPGSTLEGEPGDWLIRDGTGELSVCRAEEFPPLEEWFSDDGEG